MTIALQGDYGKLRPALIIQSVLFIEHPSVTILPVTVELRDAPLLRIWLERDATNGFQTTSEVMVNMAQSISRDKVGNLLGRLSEDEVLAVNRSLAVFLGAI